MVQPPPSVVVLWPNASQRDRDAWVSRLELMRDTASWHSPLSADVCLNVDGDDPSEQVLRVTQTVLGACEHGLPAATVRQGVDEVAQHSIQVVPVVLAMYPAAATLWRVEMSHAASVRASLPCARPADTLLDRIRRTSASCVHALEPQTVTLEAVLRDALHKAGAVPKYGS